MDEVPGEHEALHALCAHFGIATDYHDIFGHRHVIAPANLRALLGTFGIDLAQLGVEGRRMMRASVRGGFIGGHFSTIARDVWISVTVWSLPWPAPGQTWQTRSQFFRRARFSGQKGQARH